MQNLRPRLPALATFLALFVIGPVAAAAQTYPDYLPPQYRAFFKHFVDARSLPEKMLNVTGLTSGEYGRGFALIAGVSKYPRMAGPQGNLVPAAEDIRKLQSYLKTYEKIDEVVVLTDGEVTPENLYFFLARYFPRRLKEFPKSRFLFAYSGHGTTENEKGFLLTSEAANLNDTFNAIPMTTVRAMFQQVIDNGFHVLALINACYSGDFVRRSFGDRDRQFIPRYGGAHAITAGGTKELTWHNASIGTGSLFFEKFFAALDGRAGRGGIVTVDELAAYLRREVQISTEGNQNPLAGDLSKDGSLGGFFFFNRLPLVEAKMLPSWDSVRGTPFGDTSGLSPKTTVSPNTSSPPARPPPPAQPPPASPTTQFPANANCRNNGSFERWLVSFKRDAAAQGISASTIGAASRYLTFDQKIIAIDRGQRFFAQDFLEFLDKMLPSRRLQTGATKMKQYEGLFAREEKEFGVPAAVITAFWGMESDFGEDQGKDHALRSLATLAYDCRRSYVFRAHMFDALRLIDRGDLYAEEMIGSWTGELGQIQLFPSEYLANAVDYDGDGKRNLIASVPDVIGSAGKYLVSLGWKRGEPWLQEVRVPSNLNWQEAELSIQHARSQWASWGVTRPDGNTLQADNLKASLLLPMGRSGPAFLAYDNFQAYLKWNQSLTYSLTAAYFATRLAGAPTMNRGSPNIPKLTLEQTREMQLLLERRGYNVGPTVGTLNLQTRIAVRDAQIEFGMLPDSWPTTELLARLRTGR
jgi:lytic murein transglycosylase